MAAQSLADELRQQTEVHDFNLLLGLSFQFEKSLIGGVRVERIIQANCVECHRAGGAAPFALETYEQVVARKAVIRRVAA